MARAPGSDRVFAKQQKKGQDGNTTDTENYYFAAS